MPFPHPDPTARCGHSSLFSPSLLFAAGAMVKSWRNGARQLVGAGLIATISACGGGGSSSPSSTAPTRGYVTAQAYIEDEGFVGSVLVRRGDVDVIRMGFGYANSNQQIRNGIDTRYRIGSVSKTFTALAVSQLRSTGLITSYDDPVISYLPGFPRGDEITIRHLLRHRSGIPDYLGQVDQDVAYTPAELVDLFANRPLQFSPGADFNYSNSNYVLLGVLIEAVSGMSYTEYLALNVFGPLGMINTEYGASTNTGTAYARGYTKLGQGSTARYLDMSIPYAAGALVSTIGDLEIWGRSFLDRSLLDAGDYDEIFTAGEYGLGWITSEVDNRTVYWHNGAINGFSAIIALLPGQDGLIVVLSNVQDQDDRLQRIVRSMIENEF